MKSAVTVEEAIKKDVFDLVGLFLLQINYDKKFDINRIQVWSDLHKFNWKEDPFIWGQKRNKVVGFYTIYIDGIHVATWHDRMTEKEAEAEFWKGFLKAYSLKDDDPGKLWLDDSIYAQKQKERKQRDKKKKDEIIKAIESKPVKTEVQAIAKEVALDAAKESSSPTK